MRHSSKIIFRQRLQLKDPGARNQRLDHFEIGIFGSRSDEYNRSVFHVRQKRVLLRLVEAVNFVDEKNGTLLVMLLAGFSLCNGSTNILHAR